MKILASLVVIILLACGGALWFLADGSLNDYIKAQIETVGKELTEQTVKVDRVDIQLTKGAGSIYGVNLSNPSKYRYPQAFSLGEITLDINLESLTKEPIVIDALVINQPKAFVEFGKNGESNIKDLLDAIDKHLPKSTSTQQNTSTQAEPRISVSKIVLAGTALSLDLSDLGNKEHQLTLPDIELRDLGGEQGLPASELGSVVVKEVLSNIWKEAKNAQKKKLKQLAEQKLKDKAKKKLSDLFNKS